MAQIAIREYDAKRMFAEFSSSPYRGYLIENQDDIDAFSKKEKDTTISWVIKPDQLFGKRGKYGLIGVNLDIANIRKWWEEHYQKITTIDKQEGKLTIFLIEPFVPHTEEYYIAIKTERDHDVIYFSTAGGIDVEEHWDQVQEMRVPLGIAHPTGFCHPARSRHPEGPEAQDPSQESRSRATIPPGWQESRFLPSTREEESLLLDIMRKEWLKSHKMNLKEISTGWQNIESSIEKQFNITDSRISDFISELYSFFRKYGFAYLEVNPFTFDSLGNTVCLDMVARVDDSEEFRQRKHWHDVVFPHPFGPEKTDWEKYIEKLDSETGASLKFRILNPEGRIWLLTSWWGASVIIADTLADLGFATEIGNYGECSGNPDRENTRAYTATLLDAMLRVPVIASETKQSSQQNTWPKYLVIAGAIANFTHIDRTFAGIIDAFWDRISDMHAQNVHILVRRGGINDTKGLSMMKKACEELSLPCDISDGSEYMTDILKKIKL